MAFPATPLDVTVEAFLGTWTDIKGWVFDRDSDYIQIARGRRDWASQTDPSTARMTLNNVDGRFSPRNPVGPYYGLIGRNTPLRVSVRQGPVALFCPGDVGDKVSAPDAAALGITGDIDIRIDLTMNVGQTTNVAAKWETTGNQRSWVVQINSAGKPVLFWSTTGTDALSATATTALPNWTGRVAVRATLDVNNGAAGRTATFYTSDTISGSWTQLGDPVVTAGTTSIFDGTGVLEVGGLTDGTASFVNGRVHAFQLRSGIGGTLVANPDFTVQSEGATSFPDTASSPNTWTLSGNAAITNRHYRSWGEVSEWPTTWDASGNDVSTTIEASGIVRRLGQGSSPLRSTIVRGLVSLSTNPPVAYWSMEDAGGSTQWASGLGGAPAAMPGAPDLASSDLFVCSDNLPVLGNGGLIGTVPTYSATGASQVRWLVQVPTSGPTDGAIIARIVTTGSVSRWDLRWNTGGAGTFTLLAYDSDGTLIHTAVPVTNRAGLLFRVSVDLVQNGSDVDYNMVNSVIGLGVGNQTGTVTGRTFGRISRVTINPTGNLGGVTVGHLSVHPQVTSLFDLSDEAKAYVGERAGRRFQRLCDEEGIAVRSIGDLDATESMGAQRPSTLLTLLQECADADMGVLYEPREAFGLGFRTRASSYNQTPRLELDYAAEHFSAALDGIDDDQLTRNDVTVTRTGGSSARVEVTSGPLSVQDPPDGAARYDDAVTVNVQTDEQLPNQASWRAHQGTTDDARYPSLQINLASDPIASDTALTGALLDHELGDRLTVDHPPAWLAPDRISQLVQGSTETMRNYEHKLTLTGTPESPYRVGVYDSAALGRYDTAGSQLASGVTSTATSLSVATTSGPLWTSAPADLPFAIKVGGERMTVSAVASSVVDAFGRTVANGLGTADSGQVWSTSGGTAANFSVSGGLARLSLASLNVSRFATLPVGIADFDLTTTIATDKLATGDFQILYLLARYVDVNNYYMVNVGFGITQSVVLTIRKNVAGVETHLDGGTVAGLTHAASTRFGVRFQGAGSTLSAKIWLASAAEPTAWNATATDTSLTAPGDVGFRAHLPGTNTNVLPVLATFDNLAVTNPQTFTVTRSVNGTVKAQSSGTAVSLADPVVYAL